MTGKPPTTNTAARYTRVAAHCGITFLALVLLYDILSDRGVPLWPDKGFGLLVVGLALVTAIPAIIRSLRLEAPDWGENIAGSLERPERVRLAIFGLIWVAYSLALPVVGFLVAASTAISVSAIAIAYSRPWIAVPVAVLASLLVFLIFQRVLYVGLPLGPLDRFVIENFPRG